MIMKQRPEEPSHVTVKNMKKPSVVQRQRDKKLPEKLRVEEVSENGKGNILKNNTTNLHSQTQFEQPSFQDVLSSTILSSSHSTSVQQQQQQVLHTETRKGNKIENGVFKVPQRHAIHRRKKASFITEPTLHSIAEESADWEGHTTDVPVSVQVDAITTMTSVTSNTTCIENNNNNNKGTNKEIPQKKMQVKPTNRSSMLEHTDQCHSEMNTFSASAFGTFTNGMYYLM